MPTSYDGTLLDHLAEHMMYLSAASSFWFSLNSSYDHDCHLSKRLGMSPQDYEYLLVAANLAQFHPKWGFSIKILKWKLFLEGHRFLTINCLGTMEVSSKKLDLNAYVNGTKPTKNREKCHFIRIGVLHANSPRKIEEQMGQDGRLITIPPRLNGIGIKQQSFRQFTEQYKWNYILDKNADEDHKDEDDGEDDEDDSDVDSEEKAINSHTTINKKRKYNAVQGIITSGDDDMKANSNMAKSYPYLSRALGGEDGFDPTNPSVKRSMRELLKELNELLSTEYQLPSRPGDKNHRGIRTRH
jgi:hypothetical protein